MTTVHIVPLRDLIEHTVPGGIPVDPFTQDGSVRWTGFEVAGDAEPCVCGPRVEYVPGGEDDGLDGWLVTHHSLDGRGEPE